MLPDSQRDEVESLCRSIDQKSHELTDLCNMGQGESPRAQKLAREVTEGLNTLKSVIRQGMIQPFTHERLRNEIFLFSALVDRVVDDFMDSASPLKQFTDCVVSPPGEQEARSEMIKSKLNWLKKKKVFVRREKKIPKKENERKKERDF